MCLSSADRNPARKLTPHRSLYRRSLKLSLDWAVHRYVWRGQAMYIRGLFEANKHVTEPRRQKVWIHWALDAGNEENKDMIADRISYRFF